MPTQFPSESTTGRPADVRFHQQVARVAQRHVLRDARHRRRHEVGSGHIEQCFRGTSPGGASHNRPPPTPNVSYQIDGVLKTRTTLRVSHSFILEERKCQGRHTSGKYEP